VKIAVLAVILGLGLPSVTHGQQGLLTLQKDPKQWVMPNGNYSGWNYSALDQINLSNVQNLTMA
jgi:glucose dehydrogenase